MRRLRLAAPLACCLALSAGAASALDVVYVVRHAQKNPSLPWSQINAFRPLSPKGARCAARLGQLVENRGIAAVYASETARALATGAAVSSTRDGVVVIGDDRTLTPDAGLVGELRRRHADDQAILIVGHSNTVVELVLAFRPDVAGCLARLELSHPEEVATTIPETRYGDVWRLELGGDQAGCRGVHRERLGRLGGLDCATP